MENEIDVIEEEAVVEEPLDMDLIESCYIDFLEEKEHYAKMYEYYKGNTDVMKNYEEVTGRSNTVIGTNFMKKFVKEEISYSIGHDVNYVNLAEEDTTGDGKDDVLEDIRYNLAHLKADHDIDLFKDMLIYSMSYELYSFNDDVEFDISVLTPDESYAYVNEKGVTEYFLHEITMGVEGETFIKVYNQREIIYFDEAFEEVERDRHGFNGVPVGIAKVSDEMRADSLYKDIKGLQDAYETNLSDISNEISDFRNAYLMFKGINISDEDLLEMKRKGAMLFRDKDGGAEWLIKNINDSFIQNTLNTIEDKIYEVANHINYNDEGMSNASSLSLKARLISLEAKCKLNEKAFANCVQTRIKFLFEYLSFMKRSEYHGDFRNIVIRFKPNIPSDDLATAQIIQALDGRISNQTALSLLPFIENPENEMQKMKDEEEFMYGEDLISYEEKMLQGNDEPEELVELDEI